MIENATNFERRISSPSRTKVQAFNMNAWGLDAITFKSSSLANGQLEMRLTATNSDEQIYSPSWTKVQAFNANAWGLDSAPLKISLACQRPAWDFWWTIFVPTNARWISWSLSNRFIHKIIKQYAIWLGVSAILSINAESKARELILEVGLFPGLLSDCLTYLLANLSCISLWSYHG